MIAIAIVLTIIGIVHLIAPRVSWWLSLGWRLEDAAPSGLYMVVSRTGGAILAVVGVGLFIMGVSRVAHERAHTTQAWSKFESEMTVKNIQSIQISGNGTHTLPKKAISSLVEDLHAIKAPVPYVTGNSSSAESFSAQRSWVIQGNDGYKASIIDVNGLGKFGMAVGAHWIMPSYMFTSSRLIRWEHLWLK